MMKESYMKSLIAIISLFFGIMNPVYALDKCKIIKKSEERLKKDLESLAMLQRVHQDQIEAREIKERLLHGEDVREIGLLSEAIEEEVQGVENVSQKQAMGFAVSTGSVIVAGYIIKRLNKDSAGMALKTKLFRAVIPRGRHVPAKHAVNTTLLVGLASSFYLAYQWNQNREHKNFLKELVVKLNSIRDLSEQIITLKNKIENDTVAFQLKVEELEDEGILEIKNGEINCL